MASRNRWVGVLVGLSVLGCGAVAVAAGSPPEGEGETAAAGEATAGEAVDEATTPAEGDGAEAAAPAKGVAEVITVTGTRFERPIDMTPQSLSVIETDEIADRPRPNVQSALADVPGIAYSRYGGYGGQLVVRGLNSNDSRTVMFIDGDRFRGRPSLEYNTVDPNEIERIEVIRGPAAALYGSDAMNGVINVITRRAEPGALDDRFSLRPRLYSIGYSSAASMVVGRVEVAGAGQGFDVLFGANYRRGDDYETPEGRATGSHFETHSFNLRLGYSPSVTQRFELAAKYGEFSDGRANAPGPPLVAVEQDPLKERAFRLSWTRQQATSWLDDVEASAYYRWLRTFFHGENRSAASGNVEFRDTWVIGPEVIGGKLVARSVLESSVLAYGVDVYNEEVEPFEDEVHVVSASGATVAFSPRADRIRHGRQLNVGAFAHYDWDPTPAFTASLGARYDWVHTEFSDRALPDESPALSAAYAAALSGDDTKLTGSLGVIYRPLTALHLVAHWSTAFRSPTTFDKSGSGVIGATTTIPNLEVEPETSETIEGGVRLRLARLAANLTAYRTDYEDLLQTVFVTPLVRQRQNIGQARIEGVELDGGWAIDDAWSVRWNVARTRGTNELSGRPLPSVPPLGGLLALRYAWPDEAYWVEAQARWSRDKTRIDPSQERPTEGYEVYALLAGVDLGRWSPRLDDYRLTVGVENLFDETWVNPSTRESLAFPRSRSNPLIEPGRSLTLNLTARF